MKASIIIPTRNRADQLLRTMQSLVQLEFISQEYEIIVVDNGSSDGTKEVVGNYINEWPEHVIRYYYDDVPGLLTGRHRGLKEANSEIVIFVDDDIHAHKSWLSAIVETFNQFPDVHLIGGKCLPLYEKEPPFWVGYFWEDLKDGGKMLPYLSLCDFGDQEKEIDPTLIWGLNYAIRKNTVYELGGFHPDNISPDLQHFQGDGESGLSLKIAKKWT
jgi:glycosyltransferase involved in cell wall biosynthesis